MERINKPGVFIRLFTALIFLFCSINASAIGVTDSLFTQGNDFYMQRQYEKAEQCYARIVALGFGSAELYYNLGNVFFKQEEYAQAILYFEKALLLNPRDEDIKQNLALANARIVDTIDVIPDFFLKRWVNNLYNLFAPDQWAIISIVLFGLTLFCFLIYYFSNSDMLKKIGFTSCASFALLTVICFVLMITRGQSILKHNRAIIMTTSVSARSSPDEQSTNVFVLHEGSKVMILDSVQNWKEIRIANGNKGWIPKEALEEI